MARPNRFKLVESIGRALPDVDVTTTWGTPALKVRGRMFVCLASHKSAEPDTLVVMMDFADRDALVAEDPDTYYLKEHYVGYPCVLVRLARVHPDALRDLVVGAHRYICAKQKPRGHSRKRATVVCLPIALAFHAASAQPVPCDRSPLLIRHARVWSAAGVGEARDLLVRDGRIVPLDPRGQSAAPSTRVIDARGATVLPGLIDAHVHLDTLPGQLPPEIGVPRETVMAITGRQTLASGVTAARVHLSDVATGPGLGRAAESPCHPGPRLSMGGPGLLGGAPSLSVRLMRGVPDAAQGRRFVREMAEQGFAWVALHDMHRFEDDVLRAILDEARDVRLRVMAAADAFADLETALRSGVESLEYVNRTTSVYPEPLLAALAAQRERLVLVPPIGYYTRYR